MRILTAGESHGKGEVVILEGFPKGLKVNLELINKELKRRMSGFGRGDRMALEGDKVTFLSGLRNNFTLGSPICMLVENKDHKIYHVGNDNLPPITVPRPGHADLAGSLKYLDKDIRNILERSSARETVSRVCVGALCKQFLSEFHIEVISFVVGIGPIDIEQYPRDIKNLRFKTKDSLLNCPDKKAEEKMIREIERARNKKDTLGGRIEIWAENVICGLGSFSHFDNRLDARLAYYLMSIPAVKGVEIGAGFKYSYLYGSTGHDVIYYDRRRGFYRKTNRAGGIEGGVSNGERIVLRIAMKPIATLGCPLDSVDLISKKKTKAPLIRSDICAVVSCGVIAESMVAIILTEAILEKFGSDSLQEIKKAYNNYLKNLKRF